MTNHFSNRMKSMPKTIPEVMVQMEIFSIIISIPNGYVVPLTTPVNMENITIPKKSPAMNKMDLTTVLIKKIPKKPIRIADKTGIQGCQEGSTGILIMARANTARA